jgi:radical SAM protein with 4Fe4S-binding SPASM domain
LKCKHCYSSSENKKYEGEISTPDAFKFIDDIVEFGAPVLLFSGGEPLMHPDIIELAGYASKKGLRTVVSTNGTLIDEEMAKKLKSVNLRYVGVSLDGLKPTNDEFRGVEGAFARAMQGIDNCMAVGLKVGLRLTINKANFREIPAIFKLIEEKKIPRICFYHLVQTGEGENIKDQDLTLDESRAVLDGIIDETKRLHDLGHKVEVLTVDNHADGVYLYMRMKAEGHPRAEEVLELLKINAAKSSGLGISCVSWDGEVYADQFLRNHPLGNINNDKFGDIWTADDNKFLKDLRNRKELITGRCSKCKWLDICRGNFRARAEALTGDLWASDPACYLTDEEIGV